MFCLLIFSFRAALRHADAADTMMPPAIRHTLMAYADAAAIFAMSHATPVCFRFGLSAMPRCAIKMICRRYRRYCLRAESSFRHCRRAACRQRVRHVSREYIII